MKTEKLAQKAWQRLVGFLLFLNLCFPGGRALLCAQEGQPALPPPALTGQASESPAARPPLTLEGRADICMARKSYEDAVDYYYRALKESHFSSAVMWNKLGIAYQQLLNYRASRQAYSHALRQQKDYSEALNNIGTTYFLQNKYGKSVKYYVRAIKLNPNSASYHVNLGTSYYHLKRYEEYAHEYRIALSINPNVFSERSSVGTTIQARAADPEFYFYLAKVFASLGRPEEAVRTLRRALEDGFKDRKRILEDPDFMKISQNPAYVQLMNNPPVAIKD
jgi:tetratricopeptide (TPR) repeat protein